MLKFEQNGPKVWSVIHPDEPEPIILSLSPSSITNKFFIVTGFLTRVSEHHGEGFSDWFVKLLKDCEHEENRGKVIIEAIDELKRFSDEYISGNGVDYNQFVDETKVKKNSILFKPDEIEKILRLSCYLKIYSVIFNNEKLKTTQTVHREIYNLIAAEIIETDIVRKIYDVIKTKTFRYNLTDKFMWEYIKKVQGKDIGTHVIEIFNFIMNNILILCEENKNPITYFVGVIDESVKWFLRSVYKGSVVYDDSISTEDIQGINTDNLKTYSYNDTLGRLKGIAYDQIYRILESKNSMVLLESKDTDEHIVNFHERVSDISYISPLCETLVFPVLSRMTDIPYSHFRTLSPEHAAVISVYLQGLFRKVFVGEFKHLFALLDFFPLKSPSISTTYKIKAIHHYIGTQQDTKNFYGFSTMILPHALLCHYVGRISRVDFCNIIDGRRMGGIPLSKIEQDMINFYTWYFAGDLDTKINEMTKLMNTDF